MHNQSYIYCFSRRHRLTCFGHYCAHHQEPPTTAFAASGYRMIAGLDGFQAVVGLPTTACARNMLSGVYATKQ
jgi:hypothetical protein